MDANPRDAQAWQKLARTLIDLNEVELSKTTLDQLERSVRPRPAILDDLRGDVALAEKDNKEAEQYWKSFLASKPPPGKAANTCDKIASLLVEQSRWNELVDFRTRALAAEETAERHVLRATALLRVRKWKEADTEIHKANALDAADKTVEEWLPQFERLETFLPKIKALDLEIVKSPANAALWLNRARLLTLAERPLLALDDCDQAIRLSPGSMRARIQKGEALLDDTRPEDAAKIGVAAKLVRGDDKHVSERALRELDANDARILADPRAAEAFAARAEVLRDLGQFTLAADDARAALALNDNLAAAHFEAAHALDELGDTKEALAHAVRAAELEPNDPVKWYYRGLLEAKRADLAAAVESQTRSIAIRESLVALRAREENARRIGRVDQANADLQRIQQLAQ